MKKVVLLFALIPVIGLADTVLYYPGDPVDALGSPISGAGSALNLKTSSQEFKTWEMLTVPSPGWNVTRMFYLGSKPAAGPANMRIEFRQGLTRSGAFITSFGTLTNLHTGVATTTLVALNTPSSPHPLYRYEITGLNLTILPGTYFVSCWPSTLNEGYGMSFIQRASNPPNQVPGSSLDSFVATNSGGSATTWIGISAAADFCLGIAGETLGNTVTGTVTLGQYIPDEAGVQATFTLHSGGNQVDSKTVTLGASGAFSFTTSLSGTVEVKCKASHWLRKSLGTVNLSSASGLTGTLLNGDCDGNNATTTDDYLLFSAAFDTAVGDPEFNSNADLDGDGVVTTDDYIIFSENFDLEGD